MVTILFGCSLCNFTFTYGNNIINSNRSNSNSNNSNSIVRNSSNRNMPLPMVSFDHDHDHDHERECCICLDKNNQSWSALPCGHAFHQTCILTWTNYHQTCPVCRFEVCQIIIP